MQEENVLPQNHYLVIFIVASHYNDIKEYILTYTNEYFMQIDSMDTL